MRGLASGSDSGLGSFAKPYVQGRTQDALNKGIGQIQEGDWNGGISTIGEWSPETAMNLAQYKQKADDAMNIAQMKIAADNAITPYQREMLALKRQEMAQGQSNPFNSKNEFINLMGIRNNPQVWDSLPDDQKALVNARLNYMSNNPENVYDTSYQKKAGSLQAQKEGKDIENAILSQQQQGTLSDAINLVDELPDNLFMPYSDITSGLGVLTRGKVGMTREENEKYGNLERTIGSIENDLIAKARSKGQTGINTIAEIRQAAKGLQLGRGKDRLRGALKAMYDIEKKLDAIPTMNTQTRDYSNSTDDEILQGLR